MNYVGRESPNGRKSRKHMQIHKTLTNWENIINLTTIMQTQILTNTHSNTEMHSKQCRPYWKCVEGLQNVTNPIASCLESAVYTNEEPFDCDIKMIKTFTTLRPVHEADFGFYPGKFAFNLSKLWVFRLKTVGWF